MAEIDFPSMQSLKNAILQALEESGGEATTAEIEASVIRILDLSEEVVNREHPDGLVTLLNYKLRWARTSLKGKIVNVERGLWRLADDSGK